MQPFPSSGLRYALSVMPYKRIVMQLLGFLKYVESLQQYLVSARYVSTISCTSLACRMSVYPRNPSLSVNACPGGISAFHFSSRNSPDSQTAASPFPVPISAFLLLSEKDAAFSDGFHGLPDHLHRQGEGESDMTLSQRSRRYCPACRARRCAPSAP